MAMGQTEVGSPLRKSFPSSPFSPTTPGGGSAHQLTLGTINQQLNALTQQLSGLNQQTQNLQNLQMQGGGGGGGGVNANTSHILAGLNAQKINNEMLSQHDLFQLNQDLLARLQQLNLNQTSNKNNNNNNNINNNNNLHHSGGGSSSNSGPNSASPSSYIFTNPMNVGRQYSTGNANNLLLLGGSLADTGGGSLSPSPLSCGTLNRSSFTPSPMLDNYEHLASNYEAALQMQSDANNNNNNGGGGGGGTSSEGLIRPISQMGTLTTVDATGKLKVIVPVKSPGSDGGAQPPPFQLTPVLKRPEKKVTLSSASPSCSSQTSGSLRSDSNRSNPNMVTLKITDEEGHSHSPKRSSSQMPQPLSATPSFITRSTSEKVPNRSQMMQQVHRTTWARHTTK